MRRAVLLLPLLAVLSGPAPRAEEGPKPLSVAILVERETFAETERRFGSFRTRMQASFDALHALFADVEATTTTNPGSSLAPLARVAIRDRFEIVSVAVYDRTDGKPPPLFANHPDVDLVIACDEGGPLAGFWLPAYSIGHNFLVAAGEAKGTPERGLWSDWGEQALWHELLHFRGVPDSYISFIPPAALPGRATKEVALPDRFRLGIMNHPYQPPRISALASVVANAKAGVARVGACEEPDHEHGHMWRWVPERLTLALTKDGVPLAGARVRWWRSQPMTGLGDPRRQGVPEDAAPSGEAAADARGVVTLEGDYLGRADPRPKRSLWLLVEAEHEGERRFGVILLLSLNELYAAGHAKRATLPLTWEELRPVTGS